MGHQHQLFDDPFASSISSLEADIFSGAGGHQQWPELDLGLDGIPVAPAAINAGTSSGGYGSAGGDGSGSHRKISHNAYERDRRKQLNGLYSSLRSLLPDTDHTKKLSIPITVTKALKYIPELQKQVEGLEKKKEELTQANCKPGVLSMRENAAPIVSATCLDDRDIMVQVSLLSNMAGALPMSKCIKVLENEGLRVVSSSTSAFQNKTFYSLHLQRTQRTMSKVCPAFCDELENAIKKKAGMHQ
ncbi:hypothetical protein ACQ4PT_000796 [Festuca glaucescens]